MPIGRILTPGAQSARNSLTTYCSPCHGTSRHSVQSNHERFLVIWSLLVVRLVYRNAGENAMPGQVVETHILPRGVRTMTSCTLQVRAP